MQLKRVVFPEPFGPISPMIIPLSTEQTMSLFAASPPKNLNRWRISSRAIDTSHRGRRRCREPARSAGDQLLPEPKNSVGHEEDYHHHQDPVDEHVREGEVLLEKPTHPRGLLDHADREEKLG